MSVGEYCVRQVVAAHPDEIVQTAAQYMAQRQVGAVVITEGTTPVGIVTDRDLVLQVLATGDDPRRVTLRTVMSPRPVCVSESTSLEEAVTRMRASHIRRLVVVHQAGEVAGMLSLDDLLELVGAYQETLVDLMRVACRRWT